MRKRCVWAITGEMGRGVHHYRPYYRWLTIQIHHHMPILLFLLLYNNNLRILSLIVIHQLYPHFLVIILLRLPSTTARTEFYVVRWAVPRHPYSQSPPILSHGTSTTSPYSTALLWLALRSIDIRKKHSACHFNSGLDFHPSRNNNRIAVPILERC